MTIKKTGQDQWRLPDCTADELARRSALLLDRLQTSPARQRETEERTRGQGRSSAWAEERRPRLTASQFGRVGRMPVLEYVLSIFRLLRIILVIGCLSV